MYETKIKEDELIPATFDPIFKALLTSNETKDYASSLISGITNIPKNIIKDNMVILNNELSVENYKDKKMKTDILIEIVNNIVNIEINKYYYKGLFEKNSAYQNKILSEQFYSGKDYSDSKKIIQINFDEFECFDDRVIIKFLMMDPKRGMLESTNLEKYHVILPNLKKKCYNEAKLSKFEKELLLLIENNYDKLKSLVGDDKELMKAVEKREKLSKDKKIIGLYDGEKMEAYERNARLSYAEEIGLKKGMEKGMEKGIEKVAKNMLAKGISDELIISCTNLSLEELEALK